MRGLVVLGHGACWMRSMPIRFEDCLHCLVLSLAACVTLPYPCQHSLSMTSSAPLPDCGVPLPVPPMDSECCARRGFERMLVVSFGRLCQRPVLLSLLPPLPMAVCCPGGRLPGPVPWCLLLARDGHCSRRRLPSPWGYWLCCLAPSFLLYCTCDRRVLSSCFLCW